MSSPLAEAFLLVTLNNCYETPSKCYSELTSFAGTAVGRYAPAVLVYNRLYIEQTYTVSSHLRRIAAWHAVELVEYIWQRFLGYAGAVVFYRNAVIISLYGNLRPRGQNT